jgi:hypothetical protein
MDRSDTPLNILISHFDASGWPMDINLGKLLSRYSLTSDDNRPGWDIVEIERHRPILGTSYVRGLPMDAFETYYMRYAVHVLTPEVTELPERRGKISINVDDIVSNEMSNDMFSLNIEAIDEHKYEIREGTSGENTVISNIDEAKKFCESFLDNNVEYFSDSLHRELAELEFTEEEIKKNLSEYETKMKKALLEKAEDAWQSREIWE